MDRKTFTIIIAILLIGGFFLPYFIGQSGLDFITAKGGDWQKYLVLLIPLSGLLLLVGELNNNYIVSRSLLAWLPLLTVLYCFFIRLLIEGVGIGDIFTLIGKGGGAGLWITIGASLLLAFYNPKQK